MTNFLDNLILNPGKTAEVRQSLLKPVTANRIRDLQSAKHRHASTQLPLGRFCMFFDALINCAKDIADRVNLFLFFCVIKDDNVMMTVKGDKDDDEMMVLRTMMISMDVHDRPLFLIWNRGALR